MLSILFMSTWRESVIHLSLYIYHAWNKHIQSTFVGSWWTELNWTALVFFHHRTEFDTGQSVGTHQLFAAGPELNPSIPHSAPSHHAKITWLYNEEGHGFLGFSKLTWTSPVVKNLPAMQETQETRVWFLDQEDPLEEGMATQPGILTWKIPWAEEPGGLWSTGLQRVGHNWSDWTCTHELPYPTKPFWPPAE